MGARASLAAAALAGLVVGGVSDPGGGGGGEGGSRGTTLRLFVAVHLPSELVEAVAALARPEVARLRWTTPDQWHVTLRFLGRTDVGEAVAAFRRIAVASPVEAVLGPATARFGRRVVHVPVHGLEALAEATVAATAGVGQPPEDRPFVGHLTLARAADRRGVDLRPLTGTALAGRWTVDELALMSSHLHPRGARYEVVETLPLAEGP